MGIPPHHWSPNRTDPGEAPCAPPLRGFSFMCPEYRMTDRKALAREIAKRKPARFVEEKLARMRRPRPEGERPRRGNELLEYEAALRFIFWNDLKGVDL